MHFPKFSTCWFHVFFKNRGTLQPFRQPLMLSWSQRKLQRRRQRKPKPTRGPVCWVCALLAHIALTRIAGASSEAKTFNLDLTSWSKRGVWGLRCFRHEVPNLWVSPGKPLVYHVLDAFMQDLFPDNMFGQSMLINPNKLTWSAQPIGQVLSPPKIMAPGKVRVSCSGHAMGQWSRQTYTYVHADMDTYVWTHIDLGMQITMDIPEDINTNPGEFGVQIKLQNDFVFSHIFTIYIYI